MARLSYGGYGTSPEVLACGYFASCTDAQAAARLRAGGMPWPSAFRTRLRPAAAKGLTGTDRQAYALAHPLNRADGSDDIMPYRRVRKHATGLLIMTVLAVDR